MNRKGNDMKVWFRYARVNVELDTLAVMEGGEQKDDTIRFDLVNRRTKSEGQIQIRFENPKEVEELIRVLQEVQVDYPVKPGKAKEEPASKEHSATPLSGG